MIDFHTHTLPGIDDGSESIGESLKMISTLKDSGIRRICLTPHFYAHRDDPAHFISRRDEAYEALLGALGECDVSLHKGAEVAYYSGVSRMRELDEMRIDGTSLLLLEMPNEPFSDYTLSELIELSSSSRKTLVLAHVERFIGYQRRSVIYTLKERGVLMQINASVLLDPKTSKRACKLLKDGTFDLIGSDCHGSSFRPPRIGEAHELVRLKLGDRWFEGYKHFTESLFSRV
ncbi:MAG: hypothetical protein IKC32_01550 [Clostridia bacterium]|nr:hypothetical protein [Clostridia bacterium]